MSTIVKQDESRRWVSKNFPPYSIAMSCIFDSKRELSFYEKNRLKIKIAIIQVGALLLLISQLYYRNL
jgi:hypothetical protein